MKFHTIKTYGFILFWFFNIGVYGQKTEFPLEKDGLPPVPEIQTSVYDYAQILPDQQEKQLKQKLIRYADTTSTQIVIVTVPKLPGVNLNFWAAQWAEKWGIGIKGKDNGILIVVAPNDRKVVIQTGYGVEDRLTDALARRIIENIFIPHFKKGDYYGGLDRGTDVIIDLLSGKFQAKTTGIDDSPDWLALLLIFIVLVLFIYWLSRHSGKGGGGYTIDREGPVIWGSPFGGSSGGNWGGSPGGSGWGGGFSGGFGGGSFGGGGASGSW